MITLVTMVKALFHATWEKATVKTLWFQQDATYIDKIKVIDNITLDDRPLRSDGTQHVIEKVLSFSEYQWHL